MPRRSLRISGRRRTLLHLPPRTPVPSAPLLIALHGTLQTGAALRRFSGRTLDRLADSIGADLVYLDGYRRGWNDARRLRRSPAQRREIDDVAFVTAVVERFSRPALVVGYSNGGQLVHRLLRETRGLVAGATVLAAGLPVDGDFALAGVAPDPVPLLLMHGTADPVVPYSGGPTRMLGRTRGAVRSAEATARSYASGEPVVTRADGVARADWPGVRLVTQIGTGHVVPNRTTAPSPRFVGPSHHDLDTGEEVADFFGLRPRR